MAHSVWIRAVFVRVLTATVGTWVLACGGRLADPGDAGEAASAEASTSTGEASTDQVGDQAPPPCPLLVPPVGYACTAPNYQVCAYVGGGLPCQAVQCDGTGHWQSTTTGCN